MPPQVKTRLQIQITLKGSCTSQVNPIEQAFAKLKTLLRKAAERNVDDLWRTIASLLDSFQPDECRNYFQNSGYGSLQS